MRVVREVSARSSVGAIRCACLLPSAEYSRNFSLSFTDVKSFTASLEDQRVVVETTLPSMQVRVYSHAYMPTYVYHRNSPGQVQDALTNKGLTVIIRGLGANAAQSK